MFLKIDPSLTTTKNIHSLLLSAVGPRPIALASTIDTNGVRNISPFSFFNVFSSNPPIAIFSPARRVRNNTTKDTLENIKEINEVVINSVNFDIAEQMHISSKDFPKNIDEFDESKLTPLESIKVRPYRVSESPVQIECKVNDIIELGKDGGAGNLVICEVILIHINKNILDEENKIDQEKIKLIGRLGGDWYSKGYDEALFKLKK